MSVTFYHYFLVDNYDGYGKSSKPKKSNENVADQQLVNFTGKLFGQLDLNDAEKENGIKLVKDVGEYQRSRRSQPLTNNEVHHSSPSSPPSKRILFNEIGTTCWRNVSQKCIQKY